ISGLLYWSPGPSATYPVYSILIESSCLNLFINILLSLTGQTLVVPSQPLVVPVGSEVILPCQLESVKDLRDLVVDWARHDLKPRYVHIRRDGLDLLIDQNSLYLGRTRLSERGLAYGDMSLTLSRVRLSDTTRGLLSCAVSPGAGSRSRSWSGWTLRGRS
uniref:Ig-like domain-containing protein n=1 Tax=Neogobius melanostomus TaxID=47308 RepID=A0A8C6SRB3_9GOBI